MPEQVEQQQKTDSAREHQKYNYVFRIGRVEMRYAGLFGGESSGGDAGESMTGRIKSIHGTGP